METVTNIQFQLAKVAKLMSCLGNLLVAGMSRIHGANLCWTQLSKTETDCELHVPGSCIQTCGCCDNHFTVQCVFVGRVDEAGIAVNPWEARANKSWCWKVSRTVFDRGVPFAVTEVVYLETGMEWHFLELVLQVQSDFLSNLLELYSFTGCAVHEAHNALFWPSHALFGSACLQKNVFTELRSLKNEFMKMVGCMSDCLLERLRPEPDHMLQESDAIGRVRELLGVSRQRNVLAKSKLHSSSGQRSRSCVRRIGSKLCLARCLISGLWSFELQPWTTSRWATIGPAARCVLHQLASRFYGPLHACEGTRDQVHNVTYAKARCTRDVSW
eukprot:6472275-Amphidinium_carterae.1